MTEVTNNDYIKMSKLALVCFLTMTTIACSSAPEEKASPTEAEIATVDTSAEEKINHTEVEVTTVDISAEDEVYSFHTHQKVNDYTDRLAHDLFRNLNDKSLEHPLFVASFVNFDETLQNSSKLGNLLSESLIGNLQAYDIPLMDIHLMGGIDITAKGDYVFSRERDDILYSGEISYVLSGMIIASEKGFTVNARIMELQSKKIISTASTFIPHFVIETI